MHHSSIKEHLNRQHPQISSQLNSSPAGYVFNTTAVPDPDQFNSANFDRQAFIRVAQTSNDKLVAKISQDNNSLNVSSISNSSSSSVSSNGSFVNFENCQLDPSLLDSCETKKEKSTNKYTSSFSISSLLDLDSPRNQNLNGTAAAVQLMNNWNGIKQWDNYNSNMQAMYFKYLMCQMQMNNNTNNVGRY